MTWKTILVALETGKMRAQGAMLNASQRDSIAKYLGVGEITEAPGSARCSASQGFDKDAPTWNGWGADAANTRFQTAAVAGLAQAGVQKLRLRWAFGFSGAAEAPAQPTVFARRVFVGSPDGTVYSLDARTGCIYWQYAAAASVRTPVLIGNEGRTAYFGDYKGYVYAINAETGVLVWKTGVDEHPYATISGTPILAGGRLYVPVSGGSEEVAASNPKYECCSFRGSVVALNAQTGNQLWKTYTIPEPAKVTGRNAAGARTWGPSGASVWSSPTVDVQRRTLYVSTGVNYTDPSTPTSDAVLAFDMDSGALLWSRQLFANDRFNFGCPAVGTPPDKQANCPKDPGKNFDIGAPPMLRSIEGDRRVLLVGQKSGIVTALDPDQRGNVVWETKISPGGRMGGIMWGGASDDRGLAYFPVSDYDRSKPEMGGGLFALQIATGEKIWSTPAPRPACLAVPGCSAAQPGPATAIPGVVFAGSMDGHLRAYEAGRGSLIWDFDTLQEFQTVNGIKARGGSLNRAGPVVAGGMLYATSGYSLVPAIAGNVLLAFSIDGH